MTSNEEYRKFIHKLTEKIGENARLKRLYATANRLLVHGEQESHEELNRYGSIIDAVYSVEDPEALELIERFVRRLAR
ncbi:hypothetical protein B5F86_01610 [Lachnoclostridium sp. An298]|nr:hypothetical protein B5F86_01610 [Lachnoclostridium sp. An298]